MPSVGNNIATSRHPDYLYHLPDWEKWRYIWGGGEAFIRRYLQRMDRESENDYQLRLTSGMTPEAGFAKAAIVDIKNSVFYRMNDIQRRGGSKSYEESVAGYKGGVDRRGSSMNDFIGRQILPEMLAMGKVGIFVDNVAPPGPTLADAESAAPFLYSYRVEDILQWDCNFAEEQSEFRVLLLRDWCIDYQAHYGNIMLPSTSRERLRLVWIGEDGYVRYQFFDAIGNPTDKNGNPVNEVKVLPLRKIPFVMCDIGISMLNDIANYQIALMNLASSDIFYAMKANFPFYTEQVDRRATGSHLKSDIMEDGTSTVGGQGAAPKEIKVGTIHGREYDIKAERPGFINPSSEPLIASRALQQDMKDDIRKLVNLALINLGNNRQSEGSRGFDNQGLEAGLAFIGLVLETAERKVADHWSSYEGRDNQTVVKYPEQYSRKSMENRIDEAEKLTNLMFSIPSTTAKKELAKDAVTSLMGGRITPTKIATISGEIDVAPYSTSDPKVVELAKEYGLASDITLSDSLGYRGEQEIPKAKEDHAERIARLAKATQGDNPAARGVPDNDPNPRSGKEERQLANDTTMKESAGKPVRGEQGDK